MVTQITSADFQKEVLDYKGVVFMDFYAVWCGPCKMTEPIIEEFSESADYKDKIKFVKVDVDENPDVSSEYNVFSIPTFIFFKDGKPVGQLVGARDRGGFKSEFDKFV
ncbi:thioredoxin [Candidatus Roizmanbacteria bacterium RIFCSPHIGHO2_01_FULL_39_24]|uniref:Thioredoxin n=1 Tax=Candidatus Roizmanbacteria bacterium RIFCSPHIGHO2_01_FULL_39_24 TaxID=1802032 RepID=A0A1F7GHT1_9BACT|nr:MAG: thioredoxin [Candidatus Roizmanbacteria bacterium RIFCSPHIGHO2_01_FULL_39_24]OGK49723.1 MAG: thioredoxin [Candidatus Roizmanbacteria bacterium RIFCSPLOWO2_01_FULL_40_32]